MIWNTFFFASLAFGKVLARDVRSRHRDFHEKRATSPDNICGTANGFTCDPSSPNGGPCCSASGYCGSTEDYCGAGCQQGFGTCGSTPSPGQCYEVSDVGTFTDHALYSFESSDIPDGLVVSDEHTPRVTPGAPYTHMMTKSSVSIQSPYLQIVVPGGQHQSPISCGEVSTAVSTILYASVRTRAIFSPVEGVCHGLFFYKSNTQETDIEYLTDPESTSNPGNGSVPLQFTNQATDGVHDDESHTPFPAPDTANSQEHEYRVDWTPGKTVFLVDGVEAITFTNNVPTEAGSWLWNNWSNGDKGWSVGPPAQDSILKIRSIEMFYNRTDSQTTC